MNCPACEGTLAASEVEGIAVDRCTTCHGLWIGEEGFRLVKDEADDNLVWFDLDLWKDREHFSIREHGAPCPSCTERLHRVRYSSPTCPRPYGSVDIEYCRACRAIWLGEGELEAIVQSMEGEIARMTSGELLRAAIKEAVEVMHGPP